MRLVLHNPHVESLFGKTVFNVLTSKRNFLKYGYMMSYLRNNKKNVVVFADGKDSSFPRFFHVPTRLEVWVWLLLNGFFPWQVSVIYSPKKIKKQDFFFSFSLRNLDREYPGFSVFSKLECLKIFHLTHYFLSTSVIAKQYKEAGVDFMVAEANLAREPYFQHFFGQRPDVYILPFSFQPRFKKTKPFSDRLAKCVATGTYHELGRDETTTDYIDYFSETAIHPMRKKINQAKAGVSPYLDVLISNFHEIKRKDYRKEDPAYRKIIPVFYNMLFAEQKKYFKFDIVQTYNDYRMFVVPEEETGLPGIGFVEGMACGAAYFGKKHRMYTDLGLQDGVHFVAYDNTLEGLTEKIAYYQQRWDELEKIALAGYAFVQEKFSYPAVAQKFWKDLEALYLSYEAQKFKREGLMFPSSFVVA